MSNADRCAALLADVEHVLRECYSDVADAATLIEIMQFNLGAKND